MSRKAITKRFKTLIPLRKQQYKEAKRKAVSSVTVSFEGSPKSNADERSQDTDALSENAATDDQALTTTDNNDDQALNTTDYQVLANSICISSGSTNVFYSTCTLSVSTDASSYKLFGTEALVETDNVQVESENWGGNPDDVNASGENDPNDGTVLDELPELKKTRISVDEDLGVAEPDRVQVGTKREIARDDSIKRNQKRTIIESADPSRASCKSCDGGNNRIQPNKIGPDGICTTCVNDEFPFKCENCQSEVMYWNHCTHRDAHRGECCIALEDTKPPLTNTPVGNVPIIIPNQRGFAKEISDEQQLKLKKLPGKKEDRGKAVIIDQKHLQRRTAGSKFLIEFYKRKEKKEQLEKDEK